MSAPLPPTAPTWGRHCSTRRLSTATRSCSACLHTGMQVGGISEQLVHFITIYSYAHYTRSIRLIWSDLMKPTAASTVTLISNVTQHQHPVCLRPSDRSPSAIALPSPTPSPFFSLLRPVWQQRRCLRHLSGDPIEPRRCHHHLPEEGRRLHQRHIGRVHIFRVHVSVPQPLIRQRDISMLCW